MLSNIMLSPVLHMVSDYWQCVHLSCCILDPQIGLCANLVFRRCLLISVSRPLAWPWLIWSRLRFPACTYIRHSKEIPHIHNRAQGHYSFVVQLSMDHSPVIDWSSHMARPYSTCFTWDDIFIHLPHTTPGHRFPKLIHIDPHVLNDDNPHVSQLIHVHS